MRNDAIAAAGNGSFGTPGGGRNMLMILQTTRHARDIQRHALEEAAIEAEDILMQAEEANALDPVG
jgi:hypothetical protein